jgi:hypothetical protein
MRRHAAGLALCLATWPGAAQAADPEPPPTLAPAPAPTPTLTTAPGTAGADQIQFAAREHDLGYRAYLDKQYDEAASHFENAFFAAPNPAELRSAIRARRDAGELARAATLAAIGLRRFPGDAATAKVATDVIAQARPLVYEVQISSPAEYSVAIDEKIVAAERVKESRVFVNPGTHQLLVSWSDERNTRIAIEAKEGGTQSLELEPPAMPAPAPAPVPVPTPVVAPQTAPPPARALLPSASKPFDPAVFVTGAALTAIGVGLIVWSGIDTLNDPGTATVKAACVDGYFSGNCRSSYDTGSAAQERTNVFIAVTSVFAVATGVVGLFFTQWSSPVGTAAARTHPVAAVGPVLGWRLAGLEGTF